MPQMRRRSPAPPGGRPIAATPLRIRTLAFIGHASRSRKFTEAGQGRQHQRSVLVPCKLRPQQLSNKGTLVATCVRSPVEGTLEGVARPLPSRSSIEAETPARHREIGSGICSLDPASNFTVFGGFRAGRAFSMSQPEDVVDGPITKTVVNKSRITHSSLALGRISKAGISLLLPEASVGVGPSGSC